MTENNQPSAPQSLTFENERGASRSKWVAGLLSLGLVGWMGSGFVIPAPEEAEQDAPVAEPQAVSVKVVDSQASSVTRFFSAEGQAQPDRRAILRPETSGEVAELLLRKGAMVAAGEAIAKLDTRELVARLQEAEQALARNQENFDNTVQLSERGVATATQLREARADLAATEAQLAQAEEALESAVLRAPFAGRLDGLDLEVGEFASAGTEVGTVLDTDPLRIVIQVPQQALSQIREGMEADVTFITGEETKGTIDYLSRDAESDTRTFRAEITVPNPDTAIASGLSVQVQIPTQDVTAHFLSPAILSLSEDGLLGIKTVNAENKVEFHPVEVERAQRDGIWVSGLPDSARIITIGQGFVSQGETVAPITGEQVPDSSETAAAEVE